MRKMRDFAETELEEDFDVRDFYDTVLLSGAVPLEVLEARVKEYVKKTKTKTKTKAAANEASQQQALRSADPSSSSSFATQSIMDIMTFANWCKCCVVPGACRDDLL